MINEAGRETREENMLRLEREEKLAGGEEFAVDEWGSELI